MTTWTYYHLAENIPDALLALSKAPGPARLVAGGTDLLLDIQQGRHPAVHTLVDVTRIPEMVRLEVRSDALYVGAAVPLNTVVTSPLVRQHAQALVEAAGLIGGPQVRNTATLGGNVAHALPAGDGTIALLALDALAEVISLGGSRQLRMQELFAGPGRSTLDPHSELLAGFLIPISALGQASAFQRVMRPQGVAIAILNMCVWLQRDADLISDVRIAIGPSGPTPFRAHHTEGVLRGQTWGEDILDQACETLVGEARFRTSPHRSTAEYRQKMSAVLLRETLLTAWQRSWLDVAS